MKSVLRATAVLGSSSVVGVLVGLASAKAWAVLLGPSGLGLLGLVQSLAGLAVLVAGMGIGTGLVRAGANALAQEDQARVAALRQAAWLLLGALGGLAVLVLTVFRVPISQWLLGGREHADSVVLVAVAVLFNVAAGFQINTLNAYHRVSALARVGILSSILGFGASLALIWVWREQGIVPAVVASMAVQWAVSHYFLRREVGSPPGRATRRETIGAAWSLLRFGAPYTASALVGAGVQLSLPVLVLHTLGTESVGFYRAATAISVGYLGFLLAAMAQDYYPRISAVSDQPAALVHLVNQQHRLVMLLGTPLILGVLALAPYLVPLIYSPQFSPTVEVLEWQLVGDLLKFSSWTMTFVILARIGSVTLFSVELIGGLAALLASLVGMHWFGLTGLGIGFLATYVVYYLAVWLVVRRDIPLIWSTENKLMMLAALVAALAPRALPIVGLESFRTPVALTFALLAGLGSIYVIWSELGGVKRAQPC